MSKTATATLLAGVLLAWVPAATAQGWPTLDVRSQVGSAGARDAALIIAVDRYVFLPRIAGAVDNANDWHRWLTETHGADLASVRLLRDHDATREEILDAAAEVARRGRPGGALWVVFIGHGAPGTGKGGGVLVGADARQTAKSLAARSVSQADLMRVVKRGRQRHTVLVLDACFSGRSRDGAPLVEGLQPLVVTATRPRGATVLTAAQSDQYSGPLPGDARPAFSYLVLGALRGWGDANGDKEVTAAEATAYADRALQITLTGRTQRPQALGPTALVLARGAVESGPDLGAIVRAKPTDRDRPAASTDTPSRAPPLETCRRLCSEAVRCSDATGRTVCIRDCLSGSLSSIRRNTARQVCGGLSCDKYRQCIQTELRAGD